MEQISIILPSWAVSAKRGILLGILHAKQMTHQNGAATSGALSIHAHANQSCRRRSRFTCQMLRSKANLYFSLTVLVVLLNQCIRLAVESVLLERPKASKSGHIRN
jgi:hypothetical protein